MKIRVVVAHPRQDSLTMSVTKRFIEGAESAGHSIELVDLYKENFNPVLGLDDEPKFGSDTIVYSDLVMAESKKLKESDALVFIFPIWWYSLPAIMKGYVDRVINYGLAYGRGAGPIVDKVRFIALGGEVPSLYEKQDFYSAMDIQLNKGISNYIGIEDSETHFFINTFASADKGKEVEDVGAFYNEILERSYELGKKI